MGYCHDANGNLTADNSYAYLYDVENRLVEMRARVGATCPTTYTGQIKASLRYDPLGRLHEVTNFIAGVSQGPTRFLQSSGDSILNCRGSASHGNARCRWSAHPMDWAHLLAAVRYVANMFG